MPGGNFRAVYSAFDGFEAMDEPNDIRLWSRDEIVEWRKTDGIHASDLPLVCVGDFRIESNCYYVDIAADAAPVRWFGGDEIRAPSLHDFVTAIAAGRFDV